MQDEPGLPAIRVAIATLARDLGCEVEAITLLQVTSVTWSSSALGCPRPGQMYLQVLTPGYRVRLLHAGREYVMHTDQGRRAIRCDDARAELWSSVE